MLSSKAMLHVTNSVYTVRALESAHIPGMKLPWQDVLYEGPALAGLSLDEFSRTRASYFSQAGWGSYPNLMSHFAERNQKIKSLDHFDSVVLWFDNDVYSQLQLIQLLHWLERQNLRGTYVFLVRQDAVVRLKATFTQLSKEQICLLYDTKEEVTLSQYQIATLAWDAYTSGDPQRLLAATKNDLSSLPELRKSLLRVLQQLPSSQNGLSRLEALVLEAVKRNQNTVQQMYEWVQSQDRNMLLNHGILRAYIQSLLDCKTPALQMFHWPPQAENPKPETVFFKLTGFGEKLLSEQADQITVNGVDRWLGGIHLVGDNIWRYNARENAVVRTYL